MPRADNDSIDLFIHNIVDPKSLIVKVTPQPYNKSPEFEVFADARHPRKHLKFGAYSQEPEQLC